LKNWLDVNLQPTDLNRWETDIDGIKRLDGTYANKHTFNDGIAVPSLADTTTINNGESLASYFDMATVNGIPTFSASAYRSAVIGTTTETTYYIYGSAAGDKLVNRTAKDFITFTNVLSLAGSPQTFYFYSQFDDNIYPRLYLGKGFRSSLDEPSEAEKKLLYFKVDLTVLSDPDYTFTFWIHKNAGVNMPYPHSPISSPIQAAYFFNKVGKIKVVFTGYSEDMVYAQPLFWFRRAKSSIVSDDPVKVYKSDYSTTESRLITADDITNLRLG
jgi:hypothetical protein